MESDHISRINDQRPTITPPIHYLDHVLDKGHLEVAANLHLRIEHHVLEAAPLAQQPQHDHLILLVEADPIELRRDQRSSY